MADNWQLKAVLSASAAGMLKTLASVDKATPCFAGRLAQRFGCRLLAGRYSAGSDELRHAG
jgi:hypothetical protein